jgi:RNA polymerase sigma factor (sigma-70 family)
MEQTHAALVEACARGDERAWEALVRRSQRLVYTVPRRAGLDEDAAAEVFQRVFTTLFEYLDRVDRPERLSAWLVTVARRETWRVVRRDLSGRVPLDELSADIPDDAPPALDVVVRMEEQHALWTALAGLQPRCREVALIQSRIPRARARDVADRVVESASPLAGAALRRIDPVAALTARVDNRGRGSR